MRKIGRTRQSVRDKLMFEPVPYTQLNSRQQENYNFHKVAARLADYGFNCLRLTDDWQGADFIACHIDGQTFLKVQLKSRMTIDKKYIGRGVHIAFLHREHCYLYPHDEVVQEILALGVIGDAALVWHDRGIRHWNIPPKWARDLLEKFRLE